MKHLIIITNKSGEEVFRACNVVAFEQSPGMLDIGQLDRCDNYEVESILLHEGDTLTSQKDE